MEGGNNSDDRTFPCNFCDRVFVSFQALGGHRNIHRMEREALKRAQEEGVPYQAPTVPAYLPSNRNVQMPVPVPAPVPQYSYHQSYHGYSYLRNNLSVPKEFYYHPYGQRPSHVYQNNHYFGTRNRYNNPYISLVRNPSHLSRYPSEHPTNQAGSERYYYGLNSGIFARNLDQININVSASFERENGIRAMNNNDRQNDNKNAEKKDETADEELDLTLHL